MCFHILVNPFLDIFSIFLNEFNNCHYMNIKNLQINYVSRTQIIMSWNQSVSLIFFLPDLETLFLLLGCIVQPAYEGFYLVLLYLLCLLWLQYLDGLFFFEEAIKGEGTQEKEEVEGRWEECKDGNYSQNICVI